MQRTRRFITIVLALLVLSGCNPCANEIKSEITSPDGKYVATAFVRDCGATTSWSPHVHLRRVGERRAKTGNVFIGNHSDKIQIEWLSRSQLVVYSDCVVLHHDNELSRHHD